MPIVWFVRHGESQANAGFPTKHPETVRLTKIGRKQVETIPNALQTSKLLPELFVISSYARSRQTAKPTRAAFPSVQVEIWPVHEFTYLSSWHAAHSTVHQRREWVIKYWDDADPASIDGAGSESFEQFIARVQEAIKRIKQATQNTIVVFSHEQFICASLWLLQSSQFEGKPDAAAMRNFKQFLHSNRIPNSAIARVDARSDLDHCPYELITFHLDEVNSIPAGR